MRRRTLILYIIITLFCHLQARQAEDNVVINSANNEYTFIAGKTGVTVSHVMKNEYIATKHSATVTPHIFYHDKIRLDKATGGKMQYRDANAPSVFHDDSKVCFFNLHLNGKGKKGKAEFRRTFTDAAHFTGIFPEEEYPINNATITLRIPESLSGITISDENFPIEGIVRNDHTAIDGSRVITYTITGLHEMPDDPSAPPPLRSKPHISVKGFFPDTDSLYRYHRKLLDVDTTLSDVPIINGSSERYEIINRLYSFVQHNIRYVAYEEGEAAFRPDTPAETLRKRYGDCKSMSMLLTTLLNRAGIEAYFAITGTDDIPWRISENPSLASTNHAVCVVPDGESYLILDPTQEHISARHIPAWLRGKDAMMIIGESYRMIDIPTESPSVSEDIATYSYKLDNNVLSGTVTRRANEDMGQLYASAISDIPGRHRNEILAKSLVPSTRAYIPTDSIKLDMMCPGIITVSAPLINDAAVTEFDGVIYLDLNSSSGRYADRIDTDNRRDDFHIPLSGSVTRISEVIVPDGSRVTMPENYRSELPWATLTCSFTHSGHRLSMTKTIELRACDIPVSDIPAWNDALARWNDACNRPIEIR